MKRLSTLFLILFLTLQAAGQGYLSVEFGTTQNQLLNFLSLRGASIRQSNDSQVVAELGNLKIVYLLSEGIVYEMLTEKSFRNRRQMEETYNEFAEFFDGAKSSWSESVSETESILTAMHNNELNVVTLQIRNTGEFRLVHRSIGLLWQPAAKETHSVPAGGAAIAMNK